MTNYESTYPDPRAGSRTARPRRPPAWRPLGKQATATHPKSRQAGAAAGSGRKHPKTHCFCYATEEAEEQGGTGLASFMWPRRESCSRSGRGTDCRPALALGTVDSGNNNNNNNSNNSNNNNNNNNDDDDSNKKSTITAVEGEGPCGGGETLHTTVVSGNDELGGEAKSSPSIMELFDTNDVVAAAREQAAARDSNKTATAAAAAAAATDGAPEASPAAAMARRHSLGQGRSKRFPTDSLRPSSGVWDHRNGLPAHKKAASFSGGVPRAGRESGGSVGGAERHGYLSFSEVQVDEEDDTDDRLGHNSSSTASSSSSNFGREMPHRRRKKRERAWKLFLAVMQEHGLRVRKYHRHGKGWAHRIVKYDPNLPGLRWKSSKWWDSGGGQIPLRDVLDVERRGKVVWVKCLHLGTIGFEASLETDAVVFYLAMDSLLDTRCGVSYDSSVGATGGHEASGPRLPGIPAA
ncbi:unnamed protein product [Ectocarpus sp. CCAP 1310/34]|nr:unnamed protein product [Ectocarpus sp. CCAP 1310/34]